MQVSLGFSRAHGDLLRRGMRHGSEPGLKQALMEFPCIVLCSPHFGLAPRIHHENITNASEHRFRTQV